LSIASIALYGPGNIEHSRRGATKLRQEERTIRMPGLVQKILNKARGRHKSLKYRFWVLPKDYIRLFFYKITGRSWIQYYTDYIETKDAETLKPEPVYLDVGEEFLSYLKEHGLRPEHRLLDYGCGILRGGLQFIPYLQPGNYVGVDISPTRLEQGRRLMAEAGVADDRYETHHVQDCSLKELGDRTFDIVWAHAVLMHMPEQDIRTLLSSLKAHMAPGAVFYFTFFPSQKLGTDQIARDQVRDFYYPTDFMRKLFEDAGYSFEIMPKGYDENWGIRARARLTADAA
jgi:SAM-dependent methyltransferase